MFDKLKYNNLIISGSKDIQKAKVQTLRKLIQKIQKLKKTVERKPDDESFKIKLRKCLAIVETTKKLKRFEALKNILLLEKCPNKVLTNSRSTPEEVAIAMLASNQLMKTLINKIRQELGLDDADLPKWRKTLMQISKQKIKTQRKKKRKLALEAAAPANKKDKLKKKDKKEKTKPKIKSSKDSTDPPKVNADEEIFQDAPINETNHTNEEDKTEPLKVKSKSQKVKKQKINVDKLSSEKEESAVQNLKFEETETPKENLTCRTDLNKSKKSKPENAFNLKESKKSKAENVFNVKESDGSENPKSLNFEFSNNVKTKTRINQPIVKITKIVDPFFVTSTGENYVATVPLIENNNEANDAKKDSNESFNTFKSDKQRIHQSWEREKNSNEKTKSFRTENQKLHPSWEAKEKQRTPIDFQGKRKVLDDTADKKTKINDTTTDMHPSWIAKQKLKPTITAFQGKKIKFDDD